MFSCLASSPTSPAVNKAAAPVSPNFAVRATSDLFSSSASVIMRPRAEPPMPPAKLPSGPNAEPSKPPTPPSTDSAALPPVRTGKAALMIAPEAAPPIARPRDCLFFAACLLSLSC